MSRRFLRILGLFLLICQPALAAFELVTPDGRRVLLNEDRTWEYVAPEQTQRSTEATQPTAVLRVSHVTELGEEACRLGVKLHNDLPYKIRSLSIRFAAYKSDSLRYDSVTRSFFEIKATDSQYQKVLFRHISCRDIHHIQVEDPGHCSMGDLDRFSTDPGDCIEHIKVESSDLISIKK